MEIKILLAQVNEISKKYNLINEKTGGFFNIFDIGGIATDELVICRVLYELLSPWGSHCQGHTYLRLFIKDVLHINISEEELLTARVYREYITKTKRRIDLVIKTYIKSNGEFEINKSIPIEVKINAGEQKNQCFDYYQEAKKSKLYYLTPFGDEPSEYSSYNLLIKDTIANISFSNDILNWLNKCLQDKETIKIAPIREIILQLISIIKNFTKQMEDGIDMEIRDIIMCSTENIENSIRIEKGLKLAKEAMIEKLFKDIEKKIDRDKIEDDIYDYSYNNNEKIKNFYNTKKSTYPGISYLYRKDIVKNIDIWLRIEIDYNIFVGYCVVENNKISNYKLYESEILQTFNSKTLKGSGWWFYWEYIFNDNSNNPLNFNEFNKEVCELFTEDKYKIFVTQCTKKINELLI